MKNLNKLFLMILVVFTLAFSIPNLNVLAASYQVDEDYLANNFQYLKDYIKNNGYTDSDGYKTLNYITLTSYSRYSTYVIYNSSEDYIDFKVNILQPSGSTYDYPWATMNMNIYNTRSKEITIKDDEAFTSNFCFGASATINPRTYTKDQTYNFTKSYATASDDSLIQSLSNGTLDIGINCFNTFLEEKVGMTLSQIGFTSLCPGHSFSDITLKNATCTEKGEIKSRCTFCGSYEIKETNLADHTYGSWIVNENSTCTSNGSQTRTCIYCGNVETQIIPAGHTYGVWTVTQPATVFAEGTQTRTCSVCGKTETQSVSKIAPTITLSRKKVALKRKKTTTIKVSNLATGDYVKSWKSTKKKVAVVNSKGKIKAKKKGKTNIIVTLASGKTAVVKVTVK